MESDLWTLLSDLLTRTVGQPANSELEKVRSVIPESSLQLQNIATLADSLLHHLDEKNRQKLIARVLADVSVCVEHIFQ